jgi:uncharacterized protein (TIGR03437 family)
MGVASMFAPAFCQAPAYIITTFAGDNTAGYTGDAGAATSAELNNPFGIVLDSKGNLYIADQDNFRVREVTGGTISTVAGDGTPGYLGDAAAATSAELGRVSGLAMDSSGNLYIADPDNYVIRKVSSGGTITTFAGSNALGAGGTGDHGLATSAQLSKPTGLALDAAGNLYIADTGNSRIRMVAASNSYITTLSTGSVVLKSPKGVAVDAAGRVYIADTDNCRILKVTPSGSITITTTVTGSDSGACGYSGDGGPAASALLDHPSGVALDAAGNLYIADTFNQRIRRVSAATGTITTLAGKRFSGYTGDGGSSASAELSFPLAVLVGPHGNIYVSDTQNSVIRLMTAAPPAINGVITSSGFGGFTSIAPGAFIEIYGSNLAADSLNWGSSFNGVNAPTSLAGTKVTIGGQPAFIAYDSPGQVNAVVPSNVATGQQQITVTTAIGTSAPYTVTVNPTAAGLLAPGYLNIGGMQYVGALFPDWQTLVAPPGAISGYASRRARPGDVLIIFGIGFGPVTDNTPAGQIDQNLNSTLATPFRLFFGSTPVELQFAGLAPSLVGVYQFNVVVPNIPPSDAVPVTFTLGGVPGAQTLYTSVGN